MEIHSDTVVRTFASGSFDEILEDLVTEIELRNYRVTRIYSIDNVHSREGAGAELGGGFQGYKIVEFCNLNSCAALISSDLLAGVFMPVRFIVFQKPQHDATQIAFLKPTAFARLFDSEPLMRVAATLEKDMNDVLEEVAF